MNETSLVWCLLAVWSYFNQSETILVFQSPIEILILRFPFPIGLLISGSPIPIKLCTHSPIFLLLQEFLIPIKLLILWLWNFFTVFSNSHSINHNKLFQALKFKFEKWIWNRYWSSTITICVSNSRWRDVSWGSKKIWAVEQNITWYDLYFAQLPLLF